MRDHQTSYEVLAAHLTFYNIVTPDAEASQSFVGSYVTPDFLDLIVVRPIVGRGFLADDAKSGAEPTALLSHRVWRTHFGVRRDVIGRRMLINGQRTTVIGVLPEGVLFPYRHDIWLPLSLDQAEELDWSLFVVGRLAHGNGRGAARKELRHLASQLDAERPLDDDRDWALMPYVPSTIDASYRNGLHLLWAASLSVLLIACANIANLRLAEGLERSGEIALRRALGATSRRLLTLLAGETALLVGAGGAAGLPIAWGIVRLYREYVLPSIGMRAYWIDARIDPRAVVAAVVAAALAALLGGLLPAWFAMRRERASSALVGRTGVRTPRHTRARGILVIVEVSLASTLLVACGLMIKSVWKLRAVDPGMQTEHVLTGTLSLFHLTLGANDPASSTRAFEDRLISSLEARSEVGSAALATGIPGQWPGGVSLPFATERAELDLETLPRARIAFVGPGYFETLGTTALLGHTFRAGSRASSPGAIASPSEIVVNRSSAEGHLSRHEALGARLRLRSPDSWTETNVIGVVADQLTSDRDRGGRDLRRDFLHRTPLARAGDPCRTRSLRR